MRSRSLHRRHLVGGLAAMLVLALAACGPSPSSTAVATLPATMTPGPSAAPPGTGTAIPSSATGFAFDAESVAGYYETRGYACTAPQPSSLATGYQFTSCQLLDANGRTRVVGVVTDPNDDLADGFTSIRGTASETVLDPSVALDPFAAFLGAMLGPTRGEALLTWLAEHIGDSFAETTSGDLHVATYIKGEDHSTIYVEIANQAYLEAPAPSPS